MAYYAALVSLVQLLKDITRPDHSYAKSLLDKQQINVSLYEKFNLVQELLEDYSPKDLKEESIDIMERRIRDAAYRAQDMIESHISTVHPEKRAHGVKRLFRHLVSTFRKAYRKLQPHRFEGLTLGNIVENKYYQDLEKVKAEVDSIVEELVRTKVESNTVHEDLQLNSYISSEASKVQASSSKNTMVVFDEHLTTTIKGQLCGESSKIEVISIVGMGGLGKTTLARNIFDDKLIHDRFDCRAWATVSQDYHLKNILLAIVNSLNINKEELEGVGEEVLRQYIYKHLFGRRYLIVMDDIWDTKVWDDIRKVFPDNSDGSRIMITTRVSDVAVYGGCSSKFLHQMQFLNEEQSWSLLQQKVFAQVHCPEELEAIGKLIAKNCRGLPLAIVVIAGVLSNVSKAQHDWEKIARKVSSTAIEQNDEHLSKILSLSYNNLPHHLKPCFLYLGGFPEDHEIHISKLIRLWVAEGFLKPIESRSFEEVGEEYFKDLVNRNLVLITRKKSNGNFKCCIIHDLLRDLCSQRARYENFFFCLQQKDDFHRVPIGNVRRVSIQTLGEFSLVHKFMEEHGPHVRSIISFPALIWIEEHSFPLLRVLDTRTRLTSSFPKQILELLHLRYLTVDLTTTRIHPCIFLLQNLQTLILGAFAVSLPSEIWKMPQLRHVIAEFGVRLASIPYDEIRIIDGFPLLGSLQTLYTITDFRFTGDTIEMIPGLKKLKVRYHEGHPYGGWEEFGLNNLVHLHQIETLHIWFLRSEKVALATPLPKNFAFPLTLIKLTLISCSLPWKDMRVVGSLPNLQVVELRENAFMGEDWEPIEGEFLKLKSLEMKDLNLKYWQAESTHFPCLEQLHIRLCWELDEIPLGIGDISTLHWIEVCEENTVLVSSALKIQQEQRDLGNDDLRVCIVPGYPIT